MNSKENKRDERNSINSRHDGKIDQSTIFFNLFFMFQYALYE